MDYPVFEHVIASLHALINNENEPLQKVANLVKYDPGLYLSIITHSNSIDTRSETTSISQAVSLIGAEGLERHILQQGQFLTEEFLLFWAYAVIAGETAVLINERADIAEEDEAFFAGIMPSIGIALMLTKDPRYKKILDTILHVPIEDRIFIEEKLFKTNHVEQLGKHIPSPKVYKDTVSLMRTVFTRDGQRKNNLNYPARFSVAYKSLQLLQLIETSEAAAQLLLFPAVIEAQEKFRELTKRHFKIPENELEELLSDVIAKFEAVCESFGVAELSEKFIKTAEDYHLPSLNFFTTSEPLSRALDDVLAANREGRNILIYGEPGVGKRLLALALHHHPDNPRRTKPFLSFQCSALDSETLEVELFGAKGGYLGLEKHKGALEVADGGTILLKHFDKIPLNVQERLAKILEEGEFYKIGETDAHPFDIRFILTSRKNIIEEAAEGRFSKQLLDMLHPAAIFIPPLRERRSDLELITQAIVKKYGLNIADEGLTLGLHEYYETYPFLNNLPDLKRLLFYLAAKFSLKP